MDKFASDAGMSTQDYYENYTTEGRRIQVMRKLAFGPKDHEALGGITAPPTKGYSKSVRRGIQKGSTWVDEGITNPLKNPATFDRAHSASTLKKGELGKNVLEQQNDAAKSLSMAAKGGEAKAKGLLGRMKQKVVGRKSGDQYLADFAATAGRGGHMLADDAAHNRKALETGGASSLRKRIPSWVPGKGSAVSSVEHIKSDHPGKSRRGIIKAEVSEFVKGKGKGKGKIHTIDSLKAGTKADARAVEHSKRYGGALKRKGVNNLMRDGVSSAEAAAKVNKVIGSELDPKALKKGLRRSERRFLVGEGKRRIKSVPGLGGLKGLSKKVRKGARAALR